MMMTRTKTEAPRRARSHGEEEGEAEQEVPEVPEEDASEMSEEEEERRHFFAAATGLFSPAGAYFPIVSFQPPTNPNFFSAAFKTNKLSL
jgi:hypothetical protein